MIIHANAKINLTLDIIGSREDGYHELKTVMQSVALCDEIELSKNKKPNIEISCNRWDVPLDSSNTVYKAAKLLLEYAGISDMGVRIFIRKVIPSQAGMGGGSADAAAVLVGIRNLFCLDVPDDKLYEMAAQIGADVPFCLHGGTCLCEGIGENMTVLPPLPECYLLICKPVVGVSTAHAYAESDKYPQEEGFMSENMTEALLGGSISAVCESVGNRFDDILHIPEVQIIKSIMCENGALVASMTGSGSAVFGIFTDYDNMSSASKYLFDCGEIFMTKPVTSVNEQ